MSSRAVWKELVGLRQAQGKRLTVPEGRPPKSIKGPRNGQCPFSHCSHLPQQIPPMHNSAASSANTSSHAESPSRHKPGKAKFVQSERGISPKSKVRDVQQAGNQDLFELPKVGGCRYKLCNVAENWSSPGVVPEGGNAGSRVSVSSSKSTRSPLGKYRGPLDASRAGAYPETQILSRRLDMMYVYQFIVCSVYHNVYINRYIVYLIIWYVLQTI